MTATLERPATGGPVPQARVRSEPGWHRVPRWLAVPAVVSLLVTGLYPAVAGIALAVTDSSLARPLRAFAGFENFVAAAESVAFGGSLLRSVLFAVLATLLAVLAGVAGALALHARGGRFGLLGAVLLLPMVTPPVSVGVAWKLLLAPVGGGLTGLWGAFNPLGSGAGAFATLVLIHAWQWAPLVLLLGYAALLGVSGELWEAAALDGAGWWRTLRSVVAPVVAPTVVAAAVLQLVIAFKVFDLVAVPTAYVTARAGRSGRRLYSVLLAAYCAPPVVAVLPLYFLLKSVGLTNSVVGLALVNGLANVPVAVWLLDGFVRRVPAEVEEAAWVDGLSVAAGLRRIVLPLIVPGLVAASLVCFFLAYNEFLFAVSFAQSPSAQTLTVGLSLFQGDRTVQFGQQAAASLVAIVPVYVLAVLAQRALVGGLSQGAVR